MDTYKLVAITAVNDEVWIRATDVQELNRIFVEIQRLFSKAGVYATKSPDGKSYSFTINKLKQESDSALWIIIDQLCKYEFEPFATSSLQHYVFRRKEAN